MKKILVVVALILILLTASKYFIIPRPFDGYIEFAEWVSSYQVPDLGKDADCDDYAYAMYLDGINKRYWVNCQIEVAWSDYNPETKEYILRGHMYVSAMVKMANGDVRVYFVDGGTRHIVEIIYGTKWRLD